MHASSRCVRSTGATRHRHQTPAARCAVVRSGGDSPGDRTISSADTTQHPPVFYTKMGHRSAARPVCIQIPPAGRPLRTPRERRHVQRVVQSRWTAGTRSTVEGLLGRGTQILGSGAKAKEMDGRER